MNITADKAIELLREAVAGREDYVYEHPDETEDNPDVGCAYMHGEQPGCLIGVALHKAGVPLSVLATLNANHINSIDVVSQLGAAGYTFGDGALRILLAAQLMQDERHPWSVALGRAELRYKEHTTEVQAA